MLAATIMVRSPGHSWHQELQLPSLPAARAAAASSNQSKICLETLASCNMYFHLMFPGCIQDKDFLLKKHQNAIMKSKYSLTGFAVQALKAVKYQRLFPLNLNAILISHSGRVLGHRWQSGRTDPCLQAMAECTCS